ncbi:monocarboxylate transporter 12-like [Branchiostoma floridae]|uniref:Monocarboxylate transporter 12-like n=1 Tax=Branchiostoma floridae TaxID=7739 RepID=A0A9J7KQG6_BRAFL|nr:monocarboxylate transporter 12-like [Branchiostoma floridae]
MFYFQVNVNFSFVSGFGFSLAFLPTMTMVGRYFDKRRTLANALAWLGACTGNFAFPPFFQFLIDCYGWRGALVVISGIALNCCVCGALLKPIRHPAGDTTVRSTYHQGETITGDNVYRPEKDVTYTTALPKAYGRSKMSGFTLLRKRQFVLYLFSFAFLYFGYYVPFVHLVPRAVYLGAGEYQAAFLISILSVGDIIGRVVIGMVPEFPKYGKLHKYVMTASMLGVCSLLCPLAVTYTAMLVHSVVYGFVNGLIIPLTFAVAADLVGTERLASAIGLLMMAEGISASAGPPVAGALHDLTGNYNMSFLAAGSSMVLAGIIMIPVMLSNNKKEQPQFNAELVNSTERDDDRLETVYERLTTL